MGFWAMFWTQNSNVDIFSSNFTIGSSRGCNFPLKDHTISGTLCKIKHTQVTSKCTHLNIHLAYKIYKQAVDVKHT